MYMEYYMNIKKKANEAFINQLEYLMSLSGS